MRKTLPWLIGLAVGAALGVSGTYAADRFTGREDRICHAYSAFVNGYPTTDEGNVSASDRYKVGYYSKAYLDYWDQLLTIRNKACAD